MFKTKKTDVIISGAGVAGLSMALLLARAGLTSTIIDPMARPDSAKLKLSAVNDDIGTRTTALMNDCLQTLDNAGVLETITPFSEDLRSLQIIDSGKTNDKGIIFTAEEINLARFGMNIPNKILSQSLLKAALKNKHITLIFDTKLESYSCDTQHNHVTLDNGKTLTAQLLIGADGRNSTTRSLAGINHTQKTTGQAALTCHLQASKHHDYISTEYHYNGGPFTLVPLPDNHVSLVWVEKTETAEYWLAQDNATIESEINRLSKDLLGPLTLRSALDTTPLISMQADTIIADRLALIAEAAHVLHPMGAQGLNASLRDVQILTDIIIEAASCGIDFASPVILEKYAKSRQQDTALRNKFSFGLNKMVANNAKSLKIMRRLGLDVLTSHSHLRHILMQYGLAPYNVAK
jgi:2-octaprenyl-6-methoxyphenol hydroxylase